MERPRVVAVRGGESGEEDRAAGGDAYRGADSLPGLRHASGATARDRRYLSQREGLVR